MKKKLSFLASLLCLLSLNSYGKHIRVIWTKDPAHCSTIIWTTSKKTKSNSIFISQNRNDLLKSQEKVRIFAEKNFRYKRGKEYSHHVTVRNMVPNTRYYFRTVSDKETSDIYYFKSAPSSPNDSFELLFGGDSRSYRENRIAINQKIQQTFENNPQIIALVHGGDFTADGDSWKQWSHWFDDYNETTTSNGRVLPIIPTRGNHEDDRQLFNEIFGWPGGRDNYYVTQIGPLFLVNLNTEISVGGRQKKWLENQLEWGVVRYKWMIANYHKPAWPAVKSPSYAKKYWVPLFEKHSLDLVFESDGHVLKKTLPIKDNRVNMTDGIIYVGEGGLGVKQRFPRNQGAWYLQEPGYAVSAHHFQKLLISQEKLEYQVILLDGNVFDTLSLYPRKRIAN